MGWTFIHLSGYYVQDSVINLSNILHIGQSVLMTTKTISNKMTEGHGKYREKKRIVKWVITNTDKKIQEDVIFCILPLMWHSLWYPKDAPEIGSHYSLEWSQLPLWGDSIQVKSKWSHLESDNLNFLFGILDGLETDWNGISCNNFSYSLSVFKLFS